MARQLAISDVGQLTGFLRVSENTGWGLGFERLLAEEINFWPVLSSHTFDGATSLPIESASRELSRDGYNKNRPTS